MTPFRFSWFDWFCFWYPPGWLILFNRHWQHYHADPDGWNWLEYCLFLVPAGFYLALLLRWARLGFRAPRAEVTEPNPNYQRAFREEILTPIVTRYFRAELQGWENLPEEPPAIVALNHAGMCFPWDFISLGYLISQKKGWFVQPLAHPIFFDHPWLVWWLPPGWTKVLGCVRAERESFQAAVAQKTVLLYAPESWRGLAKGWKQRYHLEKFDSSFIRLSIHNQVPIVPTICLGNEYLHPWTVNSKVLARWLKMPLLPISPLLFLFVLFPSLGVWAVRTRLRYHLQSLQFPWQGSMNGHHSERSYAYEQAEMLRDKLQKELQHLTSEPPRSH